MYFPCQEMERGFEIIQIAALSCHGDDQSLDLADSDIGSFKQMLPDFTH